MSNFHDTRPSDAEAIEATAAAWLAQRDDGLSSEQAAEFAQWRSADVRHEAAVMRLESTWTALQQLREYRPEAARHPDRDLLNSQRKKRWLGAFPALTATAALAAALALAVVWWTGGLNRRAGGAPQAHATTIDGYERVSLADGSVVELNSSSEIQVAFSSTERRVRLVRGEAHFSVAKNKARPFWVEAGPLAVRAVGTAFDVKFGGKNIEVLVTEGRVALIAPKNSDRRAEVIDQAREGGSQRSQDPENVSAGVLPTIAELGVNERIVVPGGSLGGVREVPLTVEKVTPESVREALAWQGPRLVFVDTPLADAIAQFNRRNLIQIELADAELAQLPIGGSFRAENVDSFVRLLASGGYVAAERPTPTRVLLRRIVPAHRPE